MNSSSFTGSTEAAVAACGVAEAVEAIGGRAEAAVEGLGGTEGFGVEGVGGMEGVMMCLDAVLQSRDVVHRSKQAAEV
jgi:hypothetical protein